MTNSKLTKKALLTSVMALFLCVAMLTGTTFAWFTDTVTSSGNKIVAGDLKVDLEVLGDDNTTWTSVKESKAAIFNYDKWEPGYVQVKILRVVNKGNLALKWKATLVSANELSELADVIDVYVKEDVTAYPTTRDEVATWNCVGTLRTFVNTIEATTTGTILAKAENETEFPSEVLAIAFKMREEAGNTYKNMSLGEFDINILASQLTYEEDSFGKDYDENAPFSLWDGTVPSEMPASLVVDTEKHLISINDAQAFAYFNTLCNDPDFTTKYGSKWKYTVELNADIDLANKAWTPITMSNFVAFEGNCHTIKNLLVDTGADKAGLFAEITCNDIGVTYVNNLTIDGAYVNGAKYAGAVAGCGTQGYFQNVTVNKATVVGTKYIGGIFGWGNGTIVDSTVKNSSILIPADGEKEAGGLAGYISNDGKESSEDKIISGNTVENVIISAPTIASGLVSQPNSSNKGTALIVIEFNTVKNVTVTTSDDTADVFVSNNVGGKSTVANNTDTNCTVNKSGTLAVFADEQSEMKSAANTKNATVVLAPKTYTTVSFAEGVTLIGAEGTVIEQGSSSNAAFGSTKNTTIKNIEFVGTNAQRYGYATGTVVFENCTFRGEGTDSLSWALHYDGTSGANILYKNCEIYGWAAIAGGHNSLVFDGCKFYGNGAFGLCRSYSDFTVKNCTFDYSDVDPNGTRSVGIEAMYGETVTIENCTNVNGDIRDLVTLKYEGKAIIDGVEYTK